MKVFLEAKPNIDYVRDTRKVKGHFINITTLKEAVIVCQVFRDSHDLGGGNWTGGQVYDDNNVHIANISYNGRCWEVGEYPTNEIIVE